MFVFPLGTELIQPGERERKQCFHAVPLFITYTGAKCCQICSYGLANIYFSSIDINGGVVRRLASERATVLWLFITITSYQSSS